MRYATNRKVAFSRVDKVVEFFSIYLILQAWSWPDVLLSVKQEDYQKMPLELRRDERV